MGCSTCHAEDVRARTSDGRLIGKACMQAEAADRAQRLQQMTRANWTAPALVVGGMTFKVATR